MRKALIVIIAIAMISGMTACENDTTGNGQYESSLLVDDTTEISVTETIPTETEYQEIFEIESTGELVTIATAESEISENETVENITESETNIVESISETVVKSTEENDNILVCYFSFPETDETDASSGASRVVVDGEMKGAVQYMAEIIADAANGDLFRIETIQEYPGTHEPLVDFAAEEKANSARPELSTYIDNLNDYDTIFIGYPNWWGDMPMPLYTFLEEYDFSGKTMIPFNSHGGSRFSNTIETIAEYEPDAEVITEGFTVSRDDIADVENDLRIWVEHLGLLV